MVYVLSNNDKPLMPCKEAKARHLLRAGMAVVTCREPFTIKLNFECENKVQSITLGVDSGTRHVGLCASSEKKILFSSEVQLRSDIVELISIKKMNRKKRRFYKIRYRKQRFNNRSILRKKMKISPSVKNRIEAHKRLIENVFSILPVSKIIIESASFDIQKIKKPTISGNEYQKGELFGFWNVREYVFYRDNHMCQNCYGRTKDRVLNVHHIESRKTGGDAPNNLITLCETCHNAYHNGKIKLGFKRGPCFRNATNMNVMKSFLLKDLYSIYVPRGIVVVETFGYITKYNRISLGLKKTHRTDAFCITGNFDAKPLGYWFFQKQVRRHNRQIHKINPIKNGVRKLNQCPYEIFGFRLFDKVYIHSLKKCGFVFGRRSNRQFDIRTLRGEKVSSGITYKKLKIVSRKRTFLLERRDEE